MKSDRLDGERLAILEENGRWQNKILENMQKDISFIKEGYQKLSESHWKLLGKVFGGCIMVSFVATILVELFRH